MYDLYKPLRNYLRQLSLLPSLLTVYRYIQFLQFDEPLPPALHYPMFKLVRPMRVNLFAWTLELLARELILNAPPAGARALDSWNGYAKAWNMIRDIEGEVWGRLPNGQDLIQYEMLRVAQRQFPWQIPPNRRLIATYFKLYSSPRLTDLLQEVFGMSALQLYQVGVSLSGHFMTEPTIRTPIANKVNTVDDAVVAQFVGRFSRSMAELRDLMRAAQAYNVNWAYAFDPLRAFPMIQVSADRLFCPMPTLLLWRITEGLYFDLVGLEGRFAAAFGPAFQDLVGEAVAAADSEGRFEVLPEVRYGTKAKPKDSVDQIIRDGAGVLFVECKASRFKVHIAVRRLGWNGERLSPKKADLQTWRELFAQALRDRGVEAEATPRRARGVTRKAERQPVRKMRERSEAGIGPAPRVRRSAYQDAARVAFGDRVEMTAWEARSLERQRRTRSLYLAQTRILAASNDPQDRELARSVEAFVRAMPAPDSQRLALARELRAANAKLRSSPEAGRGPDRAR